jgi:hypothetical protein
MTDQFYYSLTLQITQQGGKEMTYSVGWQDDSFGMLPYDLRRLYEALWQLHCR